MSDAEDRECLARMVRGERDALEQLYRRHAYWVTTRLGHRCHDDELVDSAVQDTFVAAWKNAGSFNGTGEVGAWLWGIAMRKLVDQLRRRRPEPVADAGIHAAAMSFEEDLLASGPYGPYAAALRSLEPELAVVILATVVDGLTTKETAQLLGIPQGTVKTRAARARAKLQEVMR